MLKRDVVGHPHGLHHRPELAAGEVAGAFDLVDPLLKLTLGGAHAELARVLDLQLLVNHLAQNLRGEALADLRAVLESGGMDREYDALPQFIVGNSIVVYPGHDAQALSEHEGGQQTEEDRQDGAKERRGH